MYGLLGIVHGLGALLLLVGIVFLILWAARTLTADRLKTWAIGLIVAGLLAGLLTFGAKTGLHDGPMRGKHMQMMNRMMGDEMMDDDGAGMDHGAHKMDEDDMMGMSMDDMAAMLEGKTGDEFDEAFIRGMIPHHQGAIDMAEAAKASAKHREIKDMADEIISAQQREIDMMRGWLREWGYEE